MVVLDSVSAIGVALVISADAVAEAVGAAQDAAVEDVVVVAADAVEAEALNTSQRSNRGALTINRYRLARQVNREASRSLPIRIVLRCRTRPR